MRIVRAQQEDFAAWLELAAEVEPLFGPMVHEPGFHRARQGSIEQGMAFCVREADGPGGSPLLGGLMFGLGRQPQVYKIGWLAVAAKARRQGIGCALARHALALVKPPAEVTVKTFTDGEPGGLPARRFYENLGFVPAERAEGPHGQPVQVFQLKISD